MDKLIEALCLPDAESEARFRRLDKDYAAVMSARGPAFGAARNLLSLLLSATTNSHQLAAAAEACYRASGELWDALARVNEQRPE